MLLLLCVSEITATHSADVLDHLPCWAFGLGYVVYRALSLRTRTNTYDLMILSSLFVHSLESPRLVH